MMSEPFKFLNNSLRGSSNFPISASGNLMIEEDHDSFDTLSSSQPPDSAKVLADTDHFPTETANQALNENGSASGSSFDPTALLDPKGKQRSLNQDMSSSNHVGTLTPGEHRPGPGLGSMISNLHGVQDRSDAPRKRRKMTPESDESRTPKVPFGAIGSNGLMTGFREEVKSSGAHTPTSGVVDLTLGE
jgi:hypothetical protein